ncbi:PAB1P-dependent poly(A)-nuclease [Saitozyma sp. JCM 24511]|nr:PAB1P-dependent poly(A)-nuclease [Saitozyma sp. JCM 24511]
MASTPARSAAVQIVRPPLSDGKVPPSPAGEKKKVAQPGVDPSTIGPTTPEMSAGTLNPPANPPAKDGKASALSAVNLAAPVFVPKAPMAESSPRPATPSVSVQQPTWTPAPSQGTLMSPDGSGAGMSNLGYDESQSMAMDQSMGMDSNMFMQQQPMRQPLDYHLYTAPLPHVSSNLQTSNPLHSFFIPDDIRRTFQARHEATYLPVGPSPGIPSELGVYHSLVQLEGPGGPSRVYGHPAPVYRAVSTVDGNVYCLRRIEEDGEIGICGMRNDAYFPGFKLVSETAFQAIDNWRRMRHPNIVGLREAFTTKAFNDNSLILVYDFHPDSTTVYDEHLNPDAPPLSMGRRRQGMPIPERVLWSYVTQIANALKAVHSLNLAARNLDPSKVLITGKNRVRLNGCGILDVLAYDGQTPMAVYQQEDLVSFGKLVISMCCEFFQPGQHPAAPLDHIARHYSPDVKNLVLFLISKPQPIKSIDDVIRMLGPRILNELDAMQNYNDVLESEIGGEIENGRIARLLIKLGFINERAEFEMDPRWSDTGDRYILKLFRDYVFHSMGVDGKPVLDLSHVLTSLNKLDAGLDERIMLVSRDDQSCLVVSYREIKACIEAAYGAALIRPSRELRNGGGMMRMGGR